jgi:trigger factor
LLDIEVVEKDGLKRELNIEIPPDIVDRTFARIYETYRKKASIKGFRPGKAPMSIIRSKFKKEITAELIDELVEKYYNEAVSEKKLEVVGHPVLAGVDVDEGKPFKFTIGVEVMPQIDSVDYENLTIDKSEPDVPDKDVDGVLEKLRQAASELRTVDRVACESDVLICDVEVKGNDTEPSKNGLYKNQEIDLAGDSTDSEFREGLVGAARDETRQIGVAYPENYQNPRFAGKAVNFQVTVREIKEKVPPLLNDDFARQTGQAETLLELRLNIRKQLEATAKADLAKANRKVLIGQVVDQNAIDVPESMLESYINGVVEDYKQNAAKFDEKEIRSEYGPIGIRAIRWYLLFHRLAEQERIEVSTEDTENWIEQFAENYRIDIPKAKEVLAKTGKSGEIKDGILEGKVLDFLMSKAESHNG